MGASTSVNCNAFHLQHGQHSHGSRRPRRINNGRDVSVPGRHPAGVEVAGGFLFLRLLLGLLRLSALRRASLLRWELSSGSIPSQKVE